ncbi:hypothetical protein [Haloechinothrix halophila]|uniref:hypothetical protein n=1 Tax=Haloechinothrix halophila TaxID=1069073 RepID=UPI00042697E2|nr:hypothetical protein [Haloechinothrix halophila]
MNQHDDTEFTDGLRASLSDDRFALRPTASARESIVAAARRRRRRREVGYATGGSLAVAGVLLGGFLLVSPHQPEEGATLAEDAPSTSQPPGARAEARAEPGPPSDAAPMATGSDRVTRQRMAPVPDEAAERTHLGPDGYRSLRLGMSYDEIRETGMLADPDAPPPRDCVRYRLAKDDVAVRAILVSENVGLAAVVANRASTPEGIAVGSTREQLERAYDATEADDPAQYEIPTGAGGYYLFRVDDDRVSALSLVADEQDCGLP